MNDIRLFHGVNMFNDPQEEPEQQNIQNPFTAYTGQKDDVQKCVIIKSILKTQEWQFAMS